MKATGIERKFETVASATISRKKIDLAERLANLRVDEQDGKDPLKMYKMRKKEEGVDEEHDARVERSTGEEEIEKRKDDDN